MPAGDRVSWDRGDLPDGEGIVFEPTVDEARRLPPVPEGWVRVRDERNTIFVFPADQLKPVKKARKKTDA